MPVHDPFVEQDERWQRWGGPPDDTDNFSQPYDSDQRVRQILRHEIDEALRKINQGQ